MLPFPDPSTGISPATMAELDHPKSDSARRLEAAQLALLEDSASRDTASASVEQPTPSASHGEGLHLADPDETQEAEAPLELQPLPRRAA